MRNFNKLSGAVQSPPPLYARDEKKAVSRLGLRLALMVAVMLLAAVAVNFVVLLLCPEFTESDYYQIVLNLIVQYCIAYPLAVVLICRTPKSCIREASLSFSQGVRLFLICWFLMLAGSWLGVGTETLLNQCFGIEAVDYLQEALNGVDLFSTILLAVILAPIFEEMIFRKLLLDRLVKYGELPAVAASALLFGLYHGNFAQFYYAAFIGLVFAYIYVKTGRIRYSIILHMLLNFNGVALEPLCLNNPENALAAVYMLLELAMIIAGGVLLVKSRKKVRFAPSPYNISASEGAAVIWLNRGMMVAVALLAVEFICNLLSA